MRHPPPKFGRPDLPGPPRLGVQGKFGGWPVSILLLILYVASEWGSRYLIGGDSGAFLYVTSHFIVMPLLSIVIIVLTTIRVVRTPGTSQRILVFSSIAIPCAILLIAVSGSPGLSRFFAHF